MENCHSGIIGNLCDPVGILAWVDSRETVRSSAVNSRWSISRPSVRDSDASLQFRGPFLVGGQDRPDGGLSVRWDSIPEGLRDGRRKDHDPIMTMVFSATLSIRHLPYQTALTPGHL